MPTFSSDDDSDNLVARERHGDNAEPLSITEISSALRRTVEDNFGFVRLRGELSGVKRAASGHLYLALKDEKSLLDGVMWRGNAQRLPFLPEDGLEVVATGKITTYASRSKYQIIIDSLVIAGEGELLALLEKTRLKLEKEGLFDSAKKQKLPFFPKTIGVVTSPTGAVIRDILHRLEDRCPSHVLVWPVLVQGQGSAGQIAKAIRGFSDFSSTSSMPRPDLLILARGGGSIEDLWSFNDEEVVRAIANCTIPVISAIGHETDTTLADFAADRRAPTPTAAAEMAVPVLADLRATLGDLANRKKRAVLRPLELGRERLEVRVRRLPAGAMLLQPSVQLFDELSERLKRGLQDLSAKGRERLAGVAARLSPMILNRLLKETERSLSSHRLPQGFLSRSISEKQAALSAVSRLVEQFHPEAPLRRGYAIVRDNEDSAITSFASASKQHHLTLQFADGRMDVSQDGKSGRKKPEIKENPTKALNSKQDDLFN